MVQSFESSEQSEDQGSESQLVAFNISLLQVQHFFELLKLADTYYLSGDSVSMFYVLKTAKMSIIQSFSDTERKTFTELENKILPHLQKNMYNTKIKGTIYNKDEFKTIVGPALLKIKGNFQEEIENYKILLMDTSEAHGYLLKKLEDYKKMF